LIQAEGGVVRRSGTRFVRALADQNSPSRLIPFIFSTEQAYVLEFSNLVLRIYRNEGAVLNGGTAITGFFQSNPAVIEAVGHTLVDGDLVFVDGNSDVVEINNRFFTVTGAAGNTFALANEDGTGHTAWTIGGNVASVYTLAHTYTQNEIFDLTFAQSNDVLFIAHKDHAPAKLSRTGHTAWTLTDATFNDGPYLALNSSENELTPSSDVPGAITITADNTDEINGGDGFQTKDIGRYIRVNRGSALDPNNGWAIITGITSTTVVSATLKAQFGTSDRPTWRLGAFWDGNHPAAVSFAEGRLWWGGEPESPHAIHSSQSGNFEGYLPSDRDDGTITDASAITYFIGSNQVNNVLWMDVGRNLIVGTPGAIFPVQASSNNEPVTPTSINVPVGSPIGAAAVRPVRVGNVLVYVDRTKTTLRGIKYGIEDDAFNAENLTRIASHVSSSGLEELAYQLTPDSIIWCRRGDGSIVALTYEPSEDVFAWARHKIGGSYLTGDAVVESIATIPTPSGGSDQLWMIVKRTVDGVTVRHVEFMEDSFGETDDIEDAFFVDSGLTYDGTAATVINGLNHLEGETVKVLADGAVVADKTVSGGSITLTTSATKVHVGLQFDSDLETLKLDTQIGSALRGARSTQGTTKRPIRLIPLFHRTNSGKYGRSASQLDPIQFRDPSDDMNAPVPLYSGEKVLPVELGHDREAKLFFRQDEPLPFNLLSLTILGEAGTR
jgi:hypothetical protein